MEENRFSRFRNDCSVLLGRLEDVAPEDLQDRARAARNRLSRERLKILVVGEFSRGKSTFVNALVGRPVLPSKVNPTTATINIIRGSSRGLATVEFHDGKTEEHPLPESKVNRFLDTIVTVANERADAIRTVTIETPGRLDSLCADIVDTPGVNDLDQAREEVTFSYLREADSAVMVMDSQQPLSGSERSFLTDKVMTADVNRLIFVLNKADEILYDGDESDIERVVDNVRKRLSEVVGIPDPKVYAVSAKSALRARYKEQPDPFPLPFADFEAKLIKLAAAQALASPERLTVHLERLTTIADAHHRRLCAELESLSLDAESLNRRQIDSQQRLERLSVRATELESRIEALREDMAQRVAQFTVSSVDEMGRALSAELSAARDFHAMENFRQSLSSQLRGLLERVESEAIREKRRLLQSVQGEFPDLASAVDEETAMSPTRKRGIEHYRDQSAISFQPTASADTGLDAKEMAVGFGLGYLGAALFGPVGIAAGVIGTYVLNKSRSAERAQRLQQEERNRMMSALQEACERLKERASAMGEEVAKRESDLVVGRIRSAVEVEQRNLVSGLESSRRVVLESLAERRQRLSEVRERASDAERLVDEVRRLREEYA